MAAGELADEILKEVQRIAAELRPGILDKLGLTMALQYEADRFQARTGTGCRLDAPATEPVVSAEAATAFFRCFQEALTNVGRHAHARGVEVVLRAEAGGCRLVVRDDGRGITPAELARPDALGLLGMRERARLLGGQVILTSPPGGGTRVDIFIPTAVQPPEASC